MTPAHAALCEHILDTLDSMKSEDARVCEYIAETLIGERHETPDYIYATGVHRVRQAGYPLEAAGLVA